MSPENLLARLTLEQKASLLAGKNFWETQDIPSLGIPSIFLADGPHGIRKQASGADHLGLNPSLPATCFPPAAALAMSWNQELARRVGEALGREAAAQGVHVLLGPGINIKRSPLCGRNFEYFSEDPHLSGKMGAAFVQGIQSRGVSACPKHFCANSQETFRMAMDSVVDERTLREIYLTAFEIVVQEGRPKTIMSSYNLLNGTYTNEHTWLMQDLLRGEWAYRGCVVTDWGGSNDRIRGLLAGNELEMPGNGGETSRDLVKAVREGRLDEAALDACAERLLDLVSWTRSGQSSPLGASEQDAHHLLACRAAEESLVLLKNEGDVLPLSPGLKVAVVGDFAKTPRYQGAGSSLVNPFRLDAALDCLRASDLQVVGYEPGFQRRGRRSLSLVRRAVRLARKAPVVLLFLGLDEASETEGMDRQTLDLPANQIRLLKALVRANPQVVVILSCGSVVDMSWEALVPALLHAGLGGQAGAQAVVKALTGLVNPSGKLAETHPLALEDTPAFRNFPGKECSAQYREGLYVGYRHYDSAGADVRFPFGHGLSYTRFAYEDLAVDARGVACTLTNKGNRGGAEVVQLYVGLDSSGIFRPQKELKSFSKVWLEPGQTKAVFLPFDGRTFRYYNVQTKAWEIEAGNYTIMVGASSRDIRLRAILPVEGTGAPLPYQGLDLPSYRLGRIQGVDAREFQTLLGRPLGPSRWDRTMPLGYNDLVAQCRHAKSPLARLCCRGLELACWYLQKTRREGNGLITLVSIYQLPFRGFARQTGGMINLPMVDGVLLMVNGHFFAGLWKILREQRRKVRQEKARQARKEQTRVPG